MTLPFLFDDERELRMQDAFPLDRLERRIRALLKAAGFRIRDSRVHAHRGLIDIKVRGRQAPAFLERFFAGVDTSASMGSGDAVDLRILLVEAPHEYVRRPEHAHRHTMLRVLHGSVRFGQGQGSMRHYLSQDLSWGRDRSGMSSVLSQGEWAIIEPRSEHLARGVSTCAILAGYSRIVKPAPHSFPF